MKIVICTKRDLAGNIALNKIAGDIRGHELFILLSDRFLKTERQVREAADFIFYQRDLLVEQIYPLIERVPISSADNPRYLTFNQIKERYNIPINIIDNINSPASEALLKEICPDIILSVRFDYIFRRNIIDIPKYGILNIHPGALPQYRGVYASFRAMMQGKKEAGCTLHLIDEGIDTGQIIGIRYLPIDYSKSVLWHIVNLYPLGIELFSEILPKIEKGEEIKTISQIGTDYHYYTFPTPDEFSQFREKGLKLIDHTEYLEILSDYGA